MLRSRKLVVLFASLGFILTRASAQGYLAPYLATTPVALTQSFGQTSLLAIAGSSGNLTGLSCRVTSPVIGGEFLGIYVSVDGAPGHPLTPAPYIGTNTWSQGLTAAGAPFAVGTGSNVGDYFFYPVSVPFTNAVSIYTGYLGYGIFTAGTLSCTVSYGWFI